jgi:hypothetical protein
MNCQPETHMHPPGQLAMSGTASVESQILSRSALLRLFIWALALAGGGSIEARVIHD